MELIRKLEQMVAGWMKSVPHLPAAGQKWLGENVWWIVMVGAIFSGIAFLFAVGGLFALLALLGSVSSTYYVSTSYTGLAVLSAVIGLVFLVINGLLLATAVKPLKAKQRKGWVLLFMVLLVQALSVIVNAVLSLSILGFIISILFGAIGLAIGAYFVFEIHGQFSHNIKAKAKKA